MDIQTDRSHRTQHLLFFLPGRNTTAALAKSFENRDHEEHQPVLLLDQKMEGIHPNAKEGCDGRG
jgi:hypothetical protein